MEALKIGRWFGIAALCGFVVFDLCGRKPPPLADGAAVAAAVAAAVGADRATGAAETVTFDQLASFRCAWTPEGQAFIVPTVPAEIAALDGRRVAIAGYALPLATAETRTTELLYCRYAAGCCWGGTPQPNELIEVKLADEGGIEIATHLPTILTGTLRVRAPTTAAELTSGLYRLEDARLVEEAPAK